MLTTASVFVTKFHQFKTISKLNTVNIVNAKFLDSTLSTMKRIYPKLVFGLSLDLTYLVWKVFLLYLRYSDERLLHEETYVPIFFCFTILHVENCESSELGNSGSHSRSIQFFVRSQIIERTINNKLYNVLSIYSFVRNKAHLNHAISTALESAFLLHNYKAEICHQVLVQNTTLIK